MTGDKIRELRKKARLTQQELAEGIITRSYLSQIEQGVIQPKYEILDQIAQKLNCKVEDFLSKPVNPDLRAIDIKRNLKICENMITTKKFNKLNTVISKIENIYDLQLSNYDNGQFHWIKGKYYENEKDYINSKLYYETSASYFKECSAYKRLMKSLNSLGHVYIKINELYLAIETLKEAYKLSMYEHLQDIEKISLLLNLGVVHGKINEYYSAIHFLNEGIDLNNLLNTFYKQDELHMALGVCYMMINDFPKADHHFTEALNFVKLTKEKHLESGLYTNLGILYVKKSDADEAIKYFSKALILSRDTNQNINVIYNIKLEIARAYFLKEEFLLVTNYCKEIILSCEKDTICAQANELLGESYYKESKINETLESLKCSLALYRKCSNKQKENIILKKIGDIYSELDNPILANTYYQKISF